MSYQRRGRVEDPIPINGLFASTYCTLRARTGRWEPIALRVFEAAYGRPGVPRRFEEKAAAIAREIAARKESEER